jgi:hypothetical protein
LLDAYSYSMIICGISEKLEAVNTRIEELKRQVR